MSPTVIDLIDGSRETVMTQLLCSAIIISRFPRAQALALETSMCHLHPYTVLILRLLT